MLGWTQSWVWDALTFRLLEEITVSGHFKDAWAQVWFWRLVPFCLVCPRAPVREFAETYVVTKFSCIFITTDI